jgi:hypothetical protein
MLMTELSIGQRVFLAKRPPFLKTAESMPMLRPPDLVGLGEQGIVTAQRPGGYWVVYFERGAFLLDEEYLELLPSQAEE